jgi:hypothetical protein
LINGCRSSASRDHSHRGCCRTFLRCRGFG